MDFLENLFNLRKKINTVDKKFLKLLSTRKKITKKIAKIKIKKKYKIKDKKREKEILNYLFLKNKKYKLKNLFIKKIFNIIIKESVKIQKKIFKKKNQKKKKIFYLGPKGSYSYIAAYKYFKKERKLISCSNFKDAIKKNQKKKNYTIVPIENSYSGYIKEILILLKKTELFIKKEIKIRVKHCLIAKKNTQINEIKTIYSHVEPLKQSDQFISKLENCKINYTKSTTDSIKKILKCNKKTAAIGNKIGAKIYNLSIINKNISNDKKNNTRFIILNNETKTILKKKTYKLVAILKINIKNDTLRKIFLILKKNKYNIINIKKETIKKKQDIFLEVKLQTYSEKTKKIIQKLKKKTLDFKILGFYPFG